MRYALVAAVFLSAACVVPGQERSGSSAMDAEPSGVKGVADRRVVGQDVVGQRVAGHRVSGHRVSGGAAPGYIGESTCAVCHRRISASYRTHGMSQSFFPPRSEAVIEDFSEKKNHFYHAASDFHYKMVQKGDTFSVRRYQLDDLGEAVNVHEQVVTHVLGSGHHSRGYVYLTEVGEMFQMPIAWYTQEQSWGMAPGYDTPGHDDFARPISRACMFCHNAYPDVAVGSDSYGHPETFPADLPSGIGCERCHGPGVGHVKVAHDDNSTLRAVRASIVNPSSLDRDLQMDVCMQCHLQPTSKMTSFTRLFGVSDYAYKPGQHLHDYMLHFDFDMTPPLWERFEIDSAAYRLRGSKCFIQSGKTDGGSGKSVVGGGRGGHGGAMTCTTCHDPHEKAPSSGAAAFYRGKCYSCHDVDACSLERASTEKDATRPPADDCIACHMPKRRTDDVVHVVMTDHYIQRFKPDGDLLAPLSETPSPASYVTRFYDPVHAPAGASGEVYVAMQRAKDGAEGAIDLLGAAIAKASPTSPEPFVELGNAELSRGNHAVAAVAFRRALELIPGDSPARRALVDADLGVAMAGLGKHEEAVRHFRDSLAKFERSPDTHFNLAATLVRMKIAGARLEAEQHYLEAIRLRPHYTKAHFNLANLYARSKRFSEAIVHYRESLSLDPRSVIGHENLGSALLYTKDYDGALRVWRRGYKLDPNDVGIYRRMAMLRVTCPDASLRHLQGGLNLALRAAGLAPNDVRVGMTLAVALLENDRIEESMRVAERAVRMGANEIDAALISAIGLSRLGKDGASAALRESVRAAEKHPSGTEMRRYLLGKAKSLVVAGP